MIHALSFAGQILTLLPALIQAGVNVVEFSTWGAEKINKMKEEGRNPTDEEWNELNARTDALRAQLHSNTE